jgi:hypothetical protein
MERSGRGLHDILSGIYLGRLSKPMKTVRLTGVPVKIRSDDLLNTSLYNVTHIMQSVQCNDLTNRPLSWIQRQPLGRITHLSVMLLRNLIWLKQCSWIYSNYLLCGLVARVPGYRSRGPRFDSRRHQIFWEVVGLERCPLSLVSTIEELLGRNNSGSGQENWD